MSRLPISTVEEVVGHSQVQQAGRLLLQTRQTASRARTPPGTTAMSSTEADINTDSLLSRITAITQDLHLNCSVTTSWSLKNTVTVQEVCNYLHKCMASLFFLWFRAVSRPINSCIPYHRNQVTTSQTRSGMNIPSNLDVRTVWALITATRNGYDWYQGSIVNGGMYSMQILDITISNAMLTSFSRSSARLIFPWLSFSSNTRTASARPRSAQQWTGIRSYAVRIKTAVISTRTAWQPCHFSV